MRRIDKLSMDFPFAESSRDISKHKTDSLVYYLPLKVFALMVTCHKTVASMSYSSLKLLDSGMV